MYNTIFPRLQVNKQHFENVILSSLQKKYRKFETDIPRKEIARALSQFSHACVYDRFIYSHNRSAYSAAGKYVDRILWLYKLLTAYEGGNLDWGAQFLF
jgi:hypothetical protein